MAVEITPERVAAAAARLHDGGWFYTGRQLYYAVCRDVETPPLRLAPGELSLGVLLVLAGAITGNHVLFAILGAAGLLLLAIGAATHMVERRPAPLARVLVTSFDAFAAEHLAGRSHPGLLGPEDASPAAAAASGTVLVCDRLETAVMLRANLLRLGVPADVLAAEAVDDLRPGAHLVAIHDASPAGCAIAAGLRDRGLDVVDAGLAPRDVMGRRVQLLEGAPARLPRDLSGCLDAAEIDWLTSGRRVELATLTPEEVSRRVREALRDPALSGLRSACG
ncbi:MAG: hypothetical protein ACYDAC_11440 [Candidatus Dormibacteria bacterium]